VIRALLLSLALVACATPSPKGQLEAAYDTTNAVVEVTISSLRRERITPAQAARVSAAGERVVKALDIAKLALVECKKLLPCPAYTNILQALQPDLIALELELRRQEKENK
jgi:hypothetical protein